MRRVAFIDCYLSEHYSAMKQFLTNRLQSASDVRIVDVLEKHDMTSLR